VLIAVAMLTVAAVVLVMNQDTSTELLGSVAFLGGIAILVNLFLDMFGNGNGGNK
jgi:hypothetical protein